MDESQVLAELSGVYAEIESAFARKDLDAVARHIASHWTGSSKKGDVSRNDLLKDVGGMFATLENIVWPRTLTNLRVQGVEFTVTASGLYRADKVDGGPPLEMDLTNDDTWVQTGTGWQTIRSVAL